MVVRQRKMIANMPRPHEHMDRDGCAALVVRSGKKVTYLAGFAYAAPLARHLEFPDSLREVLLVWPRYDEPVLIVNYYAAPLARRDPWLRRLDIYAD
jgi:Xaa-Pro aminopeptidase